MIRTIITMLAAMQIALPDAEAAVAAAARIHGATATTTAIAGAPAIHLPAPGPDRPVPMRDPSVSSPLLAMPSRAMDTTFTIQADARVEIENFAGDVVVRTWNRNAVRVVASRSERDRVQVRSTGAVVRIESGGARGPSRIVDYEVTIPATAALRVSGPFADVSIDGAGGDITVETVQGDVRVRGGNGQISLRSVEGAVSLERARGRISLSAVNDDIRGIQLDGEISAESINGDVRLEGIRSSNVSASTLNGTLTYEGTIRDQGRYALTTHNGDLVLVVPNGTNAAVSIATFSGRVESALPITLTETRRGQRFQFTIGNGSARIELESFNGTVYLKRPSGAQT
jgi:DUF4097 and DUF4098 domain-containing protein YvlB